MPMAPRSQNLLLSNPRPPAPFPSSRNGTAPPAWAPCTPEARCKVWAPPREECPAPQRTRQTRGQSCVQGGSMWWAAGLCCTRRCGLHTIIGPDQSHTQTSLKRSQLHASPYLRPASRLASCAASQPCGSAPGGGTPPRCGPAGPLLEAGPLPPLLPLLSAASQAGRVSRMADLVCKKGAAHVAAAALVATAPPPGAAGKGRAGSTDQLSSRSTCAERRRRPLQAAGRGGGSRGA